MDYRKEGFRMKLNKKIFSALTSCLMLGNLAVMMPVSAADLPTEGTYNGLTYENYENNHIVITDCDPSLTSVEVPAEIDRLVASEKLRAEGIKIDELTKDQEEYLKSW